MNHANTPTKTNDDAQSGVQKGIAKQNAKLTDVAMLEKSNATSGNDSKNSGPVAGEALS